MGFFDSIKEMNNRRNKRKSEKAEKAKAVNQNPTEEELKNNKKEKLSYLWTVVSTIAYVVAFGLVAMAWQENIALGIMALLMALIFAPMFHTKAINLAREQRKINGKGRLALFIATIIPLVVLAGGFFFFVFGGMYIWV